MNHPLRANLIVENLDGTDWIHCAKCGHKYCRAGEDWREVSKTRLMAPIKAGVLMADLNGQYLLRQRYCPSCAVLLETDFIGEKVDD
jgi:uncharacterized C2H2 Zn-finger protein